MLGVPDEADFAFEADNLAQAEEYAHAPWLRRSVSQFFFQHNRGCQTGFAACTRPASKAGTAAYRTIAGEFAETMGCFFVANLGVNG